MRLEPRLDPPREPAPLWRRLGWLAVYWAASVALLGLVAFVIRSWIAA